MKILTSDQIKEIIINRFLVDYVYGWDAGEYSGFRSGINLILTLLEYDPDAIKEIDQIYYEFEQFANEQKFLDKNIEYFTKDIVSQLANKFLE